MSKSLRLPLFVGVISLFAVTLFFIGLPALSENTLFSDTRLQPHAQCLLYSPSLVNAYTIADLLTGLSYMAISLFLILFVRQAHGNIPFNWVFVAFGAFIFFCGLTHFFDIITLWTPVYWSSAFMRVLTAVASVTTAIALPPQIPRALRLLNNARASELRRQQLIETNRQLSDEIAARKQVEQDLRAALEREKVSTFRQQIITRVSHELRTPLAIIQTSGDLLKNYADQMTHERRVERIDKIQQEISYINRLLEDILTIGRFSEHRLALQPTTVDLSKLCADIVEDKRMLIASSSRYTPHTIEFVTTDKALCAQAVIDKHLFHQIATNLIQNALKYSPENSTVYVELTCYEQDFTFTVRDNGIGIPVSNLPRIWDTFYRGENVGEISGTGVGLAIVKECVELHHGTVDVESEVGRGTVFTIRMPMHPPDTHSDDHDMMLMPAIR